MTGPKVRLIAAPQLRWDAILSYLEEVGGESWADARDVSDANDAQDIVEIAGRLCYRSWKAGLNPNVTRIRDSQVDYINNLLDSEHGSVFEHVNFTFILSNISRVLTHELVRHRVGVAISQESMRYVRLGEGMQVRDVPDALKDDTWYTFRRQEMLEQCIIFQQECANHFNLDGEKSFHKKKAITSSLRDFAPQGVLTAMQWTANVRTLRHLIELRTSPGAEDEIRLLFNQVAAIMSNESPLLFGDFAVSADGIWTTKHRKV